MKDTKTAHVEKDINKDVDIESLLSGNQKSNNLRNGFKRIDYVTDVNHKKYTHKLETEDGNNIYTTSDSPFITHIYEDVKNVYGLKGKEIPVVKNNNQYELPGFYSEIFINAINNGFLRYDDGEWVNTDKMEEYNNLKDKRSYLSNIITKTMIPIFILNYLNIFYNILPFSISLLILMYLIAVIVESYYNDWLKRNNINRHYNTLKKIF